MTRQLLTVVFITVFLSTAIGFTIGWAAGPTTRMPRPRSRRWSGS